MHHNYHSIALRLQHEGGLERWQTSMVLCCARKGLYNNGETGTLQLRNKRILGCGQKGMVLCREKQGLHNNPTANNHNDNDHYSDSHLCPRTLQLLPVSFWCAHDLFTISEQECGSP